MQNLSQTLFTICLTIPFFLLIFWQLRKNVARARSRDMVFLRVKMARKDSESEEKKDITRDFREQISLMEQLLTNLKSLYRGGFMGWFFGQEYISLEYLAHENEIFFYLVVPKKTRLLVEKQVIGMYPDCIIERTDEVNIFQNRETIVGETLLLKKDFEFPIRTYQKLESDSSNAILSALGRLDEHSSANIQILLRPIDDTWQDIIKKMIRRHEKGKKKK